MLSVAPPPGETRTVTFHVRSIRMGLRTLAVVPLIVVVAYTESPARLNVATAERRIAAARALAISAITACFAVRRFDLSRIPAILGSAIRMEMAAITMTMSISGNEKPRRALRREGNGLGGFIER